MRASLISCALAVAILLQPLTDALAETKSRPSSTAKQETRSRRWEFPTASPKVRQLDIRRVPLPALPEGVSELKFDEFFKMPVGSRGLEISESIQKLDGRKVRVLGFQVREQIGDCADCAKPRRPGMKPRPAWMDHLVPGRLLLSPAPSSINMSHYGLSDDLPPQTLFVTASEFFGEPVPFTPGLLLLTGTLSVGNKVEADGRISVVRLLLDTPTPAEEPTLSSAQPATNNATTKSTNP